MPLLPRVTIGTLPNSPVISSRVDIRGGRGLIKCSHRSVGLCQSYSGCSAIQLSHENPGVVISPEGSSPESADDLPP